MLGTLFFDESRVNTAFRIRRTRQANADVSSAAEDGAQRLHDGGALVPAHRCAFSARGEVALPSLRASLQWWLDADSSVVQLLVVNDSDSAEAAHALQSRLLSVELPADHLSELVTCGVTRNYTGDNGVAVVWVLNKNRNHHSSAASASFAADQESATQLTAGFAQITVQRDVDNTGHSNLLLVPDEQIVECAPLSRIPCSAFAAGGGVGSGCVVAELAQGATARTVSIVVLTDGARLWHAELQCDGTVRVAEFADDHRRNVLRSLAEGNTSVQQLNMRSIAADLRRLSSPSAAGTPAAAADTSAGDAEESSALPPSPAGSTAWLRRLLGSSNAGTSGDASSGGSPQEESNGRLAEQGLPAAVKRRLYAAVSAVQQSPYIALTRWNGQVEIYGVTGGALRLTESYPIGLLPETVLRSIAASGSPASSAAHHNKSASKSAAARVLHVMPNGATAQWATCSPVDHQVHVVTALGDAGDGRVSLWTALPPLPPSSTIEGAAQGQAGDIMAQNCTITIYPPTVSSTPLACVVTATGDRLVLVSDIGAEEDGHVLCTRSLGALTLHGERAYRDGVATVVQVVEAEGVPALQGLMREGRPRSYLCQGARLQSVLACGDAVALAERGLQPCRLHSIADAADDVLARVTESVVVGVDDEDVYGEETTGRGGSSDEQAVARSGSPVAAQHRVHFVPLFEATDALAELPSSATCDPFALYFEGVSVAQSCAHGSHFMGELLADVLQATTPVAHLTSLPRFLSEAHLSGYTASLQRSAHFTKASVLAAVQLALNPSAASTSSAAAAAARAVPFFEYSRLYVTQATVGQLLSRLTFLTTTYLGWQSTQSTAIAATLAPLAEDHTAAGVSADFVTQQIITALEVLVAAYHAVPVAGADLVQLGLVDGGSAAAAEATTASILASLLPSCPSAVDANEDAAIDNATHSTINALAVVQMVNRLRRCGSPRMSRACTAWVKQLTHRFPVLQHYQLLSLLETAAAPAQSARVQACCERVCQALARERVSDVVDLLFIEGLFLMDVAGAGTGSAFRSLPLEEVAAFLVAAPAMGPKLYAVGVLRRATGLGALYTSLSTSVARRYLYAMLTACDAAAERLQRRAAAATLLPFQQLRRAFAELRVDVLLTTALSRVVEADMAGGFHDLQTALELISQHRCYPSYAEVVQLIVSNVVEVACASQANMSALLRVTVIHAAQLEESLIVKWYNYIARLPTKSASEATEAVRYRAIMGLHRYLMNHHSYAQCARLMSGLATLIRCSPLRRSAAAGISVSELAGLALHAATLIAPSVPMPDSHHGAAGSSATPATAMTGSPLSLGYSWQPSSLSGSPQPVDPSAPIATETALGSALWLTRADIPWLQRRLYQAQCERQLWRRGCTLDCTDLWVDGAPAAAYRVGVEKLVSALMQARLWPQAFRFACLSAAYDPCNVLAEWAMDLLQCTQRSRRTPADDCDADAQAGDRAAAWAELIRYCGELSTLENQFSGFVRTVTTALTYAYEDVPAELLSAHRSVDAYTAMATLFHVALVLRKRADGVASASVHDNEEDEEQSDMMSATSSSSDAVAGGGVVGNAKTTAAVAGLQPEALRRNVCRALSAAARIAVDILQSRGGATSSVSSAAASRSAFSPFTAGVMDPMVVCATELMGAPAYRPAMRSVPNAEATLHSFLISVSASSVFN